MLVQYCCTVRGALESDQSVTRCDGAVRKSSGFFAQSLTTYESCYADYDPSTCADQPDGTLEGPMTEGALTAEEPVDELRRHFAIVLPELREGAWPLFVTEHGWHYCTGRGTVTEAGTCRMNVCTQTPNFITIGTGLSGDDCYHTCYYVY